MRCCGKGLVLLALTLSGVLSAQSPPTETFADDVALTTLFYVVRNVPPPHWDRETVLSWLDKRGLAGSDAEMLMKTGTKYCASRSDLEMSAGTGDVARFREFESKSGLLLVNARKELASLPDESQKKLSNLLAEIRSKIATDSSNSGTWTYYTTEITASAQFSATAVVGTGRRFMRDSSKVTISLQSPRNRRASATESPEKTVGQATAYIHLCGPETCEDGTFFVTTLGSEI